MVAEFCAQRDEGRGRRKWSKDAAARRRVSGVAVVSRKMARRTSTASEMSEAASGRKDARGVVGAMGRKVESGKWKLEMKTRERRRDEGADS